MIIDACGSLSPQLMKKHSSRLTAAFPPELCESAFDRITISRVFDIWQLLNLLQAMLTIESKDKDELKIGGANRDLIGSSELGESEVPLAAPRLLVLWGLERLLLPLTSQKLSSRVGGNARSTIDSEPLLASTLLLLRRLAAFGTGTTVLLVGSLSMPLSSQSLLAECVDVVLTLRRSQLMPGGGLEQQGNKVSSVSAAFKEPASSVGYIVGA